MTEESPKTQENFKDDCSQPSDLLSPRKIKRPFDIISSTGADDALKQQDTGDNTVTRPAELVSSHSLLQVPAIMPVQIQAVSDSSLTKLDVTPDQNFEDSNVNEVVNEQKEATVSQLISDSQIQAVSDSSLTKLDVTPDQNFEESNVNEVVNEHQEATVSQLISGSQLERYPLRDESKSGKEEEEQKMSGEQDTTQSQTYTDQHKVFPFAFEEAGSTAREDQKRTKDEFQSDFKRNQKVVALGNVSMGDTQEDKAAVAREICKKRKRMGTYGLTVKERSHFLQMSKRANGQVIEKFEMQISIHNIVSGSPFSAPSMLPTPLADNVEVKEEEVLLPSHANTDRPETKVQILATLSNGSGPLHKPICQIAMEEKHHLNNTSPLKVDSGSPSLTPVDLEKEDAVKLCEAAVAPSGGSERKDMPNLDGDFHPWAVNTDHSQSMNCTDFVSDSQLNKVAISEDQAIKKKTANPPSHDEDGSVLVCGLIKELSFLNRTVMAAHREIENMRRASKNSRNLPR
ncbi:uncharacterized protein LOC144077357 isoform X2 [Stigmatopora argus]